MHLGYPISPTTHRLQLLNWSCYDNECSSLTWPIKGERIIPLKDSRSKERNLERNFNVIFFGLKRSSPSV